MVAPGVPHLAVVIPGGLRVPVVQHGVERHLEGDVHVTGVPGLDAQGGAQTAACTLAAYHDLIGSNAPLGGAGLHVHQRRIAVVQRRRVGRSKSQPIPRRHHHCPELFHQIDRPGHMRHFLHAENVPAAVNPQHAGSQHRSLIRRQHQRRNPASACGNGDFLYPNLRVWSHG